MQDQVKVIFFRHGESVYNEQAAKLREKLNIGATWEEYRANPQFMDFKYSEAMLDCGLSEQGKQQCKEHQGQHQDVDIVLVSPLYRALTSCGLIFNKYSKGPIIVEPLLSESLRCACDISFNLPLAQQAYPHFDFSAIRDRQSRWYIDNQVPEKQKLYEQELENQNAHSYEERAKALNKLMGKTHQFEDSFDLIKRSRRIKEKIKEYAIRYKCARIGVVSHYYTIGYTLSDVFDASGKPVPKLHIHNAKPYQYTLDCKE